MTTPKQKLRRRRKRRYHKLDAGWTKAMEDTLRAFQPECVLCGADTDLSTDHVRPLCKGFGLVPGNAVRLCLSCNGWKGSKLLAALPRDTKLTLVAAADAFYVYWQRRSKLVLKRKGA